MKCTHCGADLDDRSPYCPVCGAPNPYGASSDDDLYAETDDLTEYAQAQQPPKREKASRTSNILVIVVAIVCAVAVGVAARYFLLVKPGHSGGSQSAGTSQSASSESGTSPSKSRKSTASSSSSSSSSSDWMNRTYILPNSTTEYLSSSDIAGFSSKECNYALNEIYAREGRRFKAVELQRYFNSKSWYDGTIDPDDFDDNYALTDVERANVELLKQAMEERGGYTPE